MMEREREREANGINVFFDVSSQYHFVSPYDDKANLFQKSLNIAIIVQLQTSMAFFKNQLKKKINTQYASLLRAYNMRYVYVTSRSKSSSRWPMRNQSSCFKCVYFCWRPAGRPSAFHMLMIRHQTAKSNID